MMSDEIDDCNDCNQDDDLINGVHDCNFTFFINVCGRVLAMCQVPIANCTRSVGGCKRRPRLYSGLIGSMLSNGLLQCMLCNGYLVGSNSAIYPHEGVTHPFKILNQYIPYYPTISYDTRYLVG